MPTTSQPRRRPALVVAALAVAALGLALTSCAAAPGGPAGSAPAGAVDNQEHRLSPSATLPRQGGAQREGGFSLAPGATESSDTGSPSDPPAAGSSDAGSPSDPPAAGSFDAPGTPPRPSGFEVGGLPERVAATGASSRPVRLEIPAIGVSTSLLRLGLEPDGAMQVPGDFARAGWFAEGPAPGQVGPSVIAGHVDSKTGPAVFYRLRDLRPGDPVVVERADGSRLRFLVERSRSYPKSLFPTRDVFGPVAAAALRLITCGGEFDRARGSYRENLVVFARLDQR
jgi:sortase (surface protein transpeptidase)